MNFLDNLTRVFIDSLFSGRDIFIIGDQVEVYSILFLDVLSEHAPMQLMKTRDNWYMSAMKQTISCTGMHINFFGGKLNGKSAWLKGAM